MNKINLKYFFYFFTIFFANIGYSQNINLESLFLNNLLPKTSIDPTYKHIKVSNSPQLVAALGWANKNGKTIISLAPALYKINKTLNITANDIHLISQSNNPFHTIIQGPGMRKTSDVNNLIRVSGANFLIDGFTLQEAGNHLIQIAGESNASRPIIRNCVLQNGYQQLLKVTYDLNSPSRFSSHGIVENNLFRYTNGIGPNFYIGGIDAHGIQNWAIHHNYFENIASPKDHIAEHAIHLWNNSANNIVTNNIILNSDRGIGFGMRNGQNDKIRFGNFGGKISHNIIYHEDNHHPFADVAIIIEESPNTVISDNTVLLEHAYPYAIEFRFESTKNVLIKNNTVNKGIRTRDGAKAKLLNNHFIKSLKPKDLSILDKQGSRLN